LVFSVVASRVEDMADTLGMSHVLKQVSRISWITYHHRHVRICRGQSGEASAELDVVPNYRRENGKGEMAW
jgi:hypothetical protein